MHSIPLRRPRIRSGARLTAAAALSSAAASLVLFQAQFRQLEAHGAAAIYGVLTPTLTGSRVPVIWFGLGTPGAFGLVITPDCSAALLLAPLLAAGIGLMIMPRLSISRVLTGLGCAAATLVTGNLVRIGVIALAVRADGIGAGYQLGHLVLGSIVSIVCIAVSLLILTLVVTTRTGDRPVSRLLSALRRSSR